MKDKKLIFNDEDTIICNRHFTYEGIRKIMRLADKIIKENMKKEEFVVITEFDNRYYNEEKQEYYLTSVTCIENDGGDVVTININDFNDILEDRKFLFHEALKLRKIQRLFIE